MPCISVVRLGGPSNDNTVLLRNALVTYFSGTKESFPNSFVTFPAATTTTTNCDVGINGEPTQARIPLQISIEQSSLETVISEPIVTLHNKYFSASVLLSDLQLQQLSDQTTQTGTDTRSSVAQQVPLQDYYKDDGIILVFDALKCNPDLDNGVSFLALDSLHPQDSQQDHDSIGHLLRLCIGVSLGQHSDQQLRGKKHDDEYAKRILWCLDRGYEYVEVDLSQHGQLNGHDERDKEGFARVVEAIQGTVWSSAAMKTQESQPILARVETTTTECSTDGDHEDGGANNINDYEPPNLLSSLSPAKELVLTDPSVDEYVDPPASQEEASLRAEHEQQAKAFQELEALMKEATRIRDLSRKGDLSDDFRRKRAVEAATLMMGLMEKMELDGSDDEDSVD